MLRRHAYLILKSWTRIVSMMYYPTVTMVVWAFVTLYLAPTNNFLRDAPGFFIGAVLLWDVLFRGQLGVSLTFIEEFYARNLGNLFVSPLTLPEYIAGPARDERAARADRRRRRVRVRVPAVPLLDLLARPSADRLLREPARVRLGDRARDVGDDPAARPRRRGARVGGDLRRRAGLGRLLSDRGAAVLAAGDRLGASRPRTCSRACAGVLLDGAFRWDHFWAAAALNAVYLALGAAVFAWAMRDARDRGTLLQMGE